MFKMQMQPNQRVNKRVFSSQSNQPAQRVIRLPMADHNLAANRAKSSIRDLNNNNNNNQVQAMVANKLQEYLIARKNPNQVANSIMLIRQNLM